MRVLSSDWKYVLSDGAVCRRHRNTPLMTLILSHNRIEVRPVSCFGLHAKVFRTAHAPPMHLCRRHSSLNSGIDPRFQKDGAKAIGEAIVFNQGLLLIDLSHNAIQVLIARFRC